MCMCVSGSRNQNSSIVSHVAHAYDAFVTNQSIDRSIDRSTSIRVRSNCQWLIWIINLQMCAQNVIEFLTEYVEIKQLWEPWQRINYRMTSPNDDRMVALLLKWSMIIHHRQNNNLYIYKSFLFFSFFGDTEIACMTHRNHASHTMQSMQPIWMQENVFVSIFAVFFYFFTNSIPIEIILNLTFNLFHQMFRNRKENG